MSLPPALADEFVRALDELESEHPGRFLPIEEVEAITRSFSNPIPNDLSTIAILTELRNRDWVETDGNGASLTTHGFRITAKGQIRAAASVDYAAQFNAAVGSLPGLDEEDPADVENRNLQSRIDSTNWTGLGKAATPAQLKVIREKANNLMQAIIQSDADFETRADACKRVEAVVILLEAPNVPWREVVQLLNHPTVTAFLAALNLLQLILGMAS